MKTLLKSRRTWYWAWVLASRIAPITIIGLKYNLIKITQSSPSPQQVESISIGLTGIGFILLVWASLGFIRDLRQKAIKQKGTFSREVYKGMLNLIPYVTFVGIGLLARTYVDDFIFITNTLLITQASGFLFRATHKRLYIRDLKKGGYVNVI